MRGDYRKFTVEMEMVNKGFRMWKKGFDGATCVLESYKEKRSIYFAVSNILPSSFLMTESNKEYHLVLIGAEDGQLIHRDFGAFYVNQKGEGSFFKKFSGAELTCYTHCLFLVAEKDSGKTEVIYRGETPFFEKPGKAEREKEGAGPWKDCFARCNADNYVEAFTKEKDETKATWYRIDDAENLPEPVQPCRPLIEKYNHYIIGIADDRCFVGIPGRFLQSEQPCREEQCYLLWQPIRGGEKFFADAGKMTREQQEEIFGYWIGEIERVEGVIKPL